MGTLREQRQVEREVERRLASQSEPRPPESGLWGMQTAATQEFMAAVPDSGVLELERGDTMFIDVTVTEADGITPFNLTGASLWFTAKVNIEDADPGVFQKTSTPAAGITITNATGGVARVQIDPADTAALTTDVTLIWDVQVKTSTGYVYTVVEGTLSVSRDITRAT